MFSGIGTTSCTNILIENNIINNTLRDQVGNSISTSFIRCKSIAGDLNKNLTIKNNIISGASWGIEFTNNSGEVYIEDNTITATHAGISSNGKIDYSLIYSKINNNSINLIHHNGFAALEILVGKKCDIINNYLNAVNGIHFFGIAHQSTRDSEKMEFNINNNVIKFPFGIQVLGEPNLNNTLHYVINNNIIEFCGYGLLINCPNTIINNNSIINKGQIINNNYPNSSSIILIKSSGGLYNNNLCNNYIESSMDSIIESNVNFSLFCNNAIKLNNSVNYIFKFNDVYGDTLTSSIIGTNIYGDEADNLYNSVNTTLYSKNNIYNNIYTTLGTEI